MRSLRPVGILLAVASLVAAAGAGPAAGIAQARPSDAVEMPGLCRSPYNVSHQRGFDVSRVASERVLVFDGRRVVLDRKGWRAENPSDPSWTLWFHSLVWLAPLALDDPETAVDVVVERDRALPDPGTSVSNAERKPWGWTQGQFRTRLDTVNCLYSLTGDERLVAVAERLVRANMDPKRYPGSPKLPAHNHGTMSNVTLVQSGRAFGRQEWIDFAVKRFAKDMPFVFEPCGMMREQSSTYQEHNLQLWTKAASLLDIALDVPARALGALVRPDGVLEAIGDGQPDSGLVPNGESLWCRETGWAAGTVDGAHFTLRFGPRVAFHGHRDRGGITWYALGTPVLSDRGLFSKDRGSRYSFAHSMAAHSVFEPVGSPRYDPETSAKRNSPTEFALSDSGDGLTRDRQIDFGATRLVVRDRGTGADEWIQHWQLAPGWVPTDSGAVNKGAGLVLSIDCPRLRPVKVEAFTAWRTAVPAWDLQCRVRSDRDGARLSTTIVVSPAP